MHNQQQALTANQPPPSSPLMMSTNNSNNNNNFFSQAAGNNNNPTVAGAAGMMMDPNAQNMMFNIGGNFIGTGVDQFKANLQKIETSELRKRFTVSHEFVLGKLKLIAFPFRYKFNIDSFNLDSAASSGGGNEAANDLFGGNNTTNASAGGGNGEENNEGGTSGGLMPSLSSGDTHAPELYLPLMALITYVVMCAFGRGFSAESLSPQDLATTVVASSIMLVLEALTIKIWRMVTSLPPPNFFDSLAIFGYFFVSVCYSLGARAIFDLWFPMVSWAFTIYNLLAFCFFTYKSLGETFAKEDGSIPKRAIPILYAATLVQAPLFLWFVRRAY